MGMGGLLGEGGAWVGLIGVGGAWVGLIGVGGEWVGMIGVGGAWVGLIGVGGAHRHIMQGVWSSVCVRVRVCAHVVCERVSALLCLLPVETPPPEWVCSMTGLTNTQCHIKVTPLSTWTGPTHQSGRDQAELIAGVQSYSTNCFVHS